MLQDAVIKKTLRCLIFLTSPSGITHTHTPIITSMLNAALPTMVLGPSSPASKPCPHTCRTQTENNTTMCLKQVIINNLIYNMFSSMTLTFQVLVINLGKQYIFCYFMWLSTLVKLFCLLDVCTLLSSSKHFRDFLYYLF